MLKSVADHWNKEPCNSTRGGEHEEGTLPYFEEIESQRYAKEGYIHQFAQFTRWRGKNVLEVGCGVGTDLLQFAKAGANITGVDLSSKSVYLTKRRLELYGLNHSNNAMVANAQELPFKDNIFDLVYSWGVIHHAPEPPAVVSEIYRVLKPKGVFKGMVYHRMSTMGFAVWLLDLKKYHNPFTSLKTALSRSLESPGTKGYSFKETRELFSPFKDLNIIPNFIPEQVGLNGTPFKHLLKYYPDGLASWLCVEGRK